METDWELLTIKKDQVEFVSELKKLSVEVKKNQELLKKMQETQEKIYDKIVAQDEREKNLRIRNYFPNQKVSKFMASNSLFQKE